MNRLRRVACLYAGLILVLVDSPLLRAAELAASLRRQTFDVDPGWDAQNNRVVPKQYPTVVQNFGYSKTNYSGTSPGEMGGLFTRAADPAHYGAKIEPVTLDQKLSASGSFAIKKTYPGGGVFFGFYQARQPGAGGRPTGSLGLNLDCEHAGGRLAVRLITGENQSCGTFITPYVPGKFRPTPLRDDGTRYHWTLDYDPEAAEGRGRFTFTFRSDGHRAGEMHRPDLSDVARAEARARFPDTTSFAVDLPEGFRWQHTKFDRFGAMCMMKPGGRMEMYFDDLTYNGAKQDFAHDPVWDGSGNRRTYQAQDVGGAHNFGFSNTAHAGGKPGEAGGTFWRSGDYAYYADRVGPLSMNDRLEARGRVVLEVGGPDADMFLGWFSGADRKTPPIQGGHFLGVHVGGPTRVGHYFHPALSAGDGVRMLSASGPVLKPGKTYEWTLTYDPAGANGLGTVDVRLGEERVTLTLRQGVKQRGLNFDRFGLFNSTIGGQIVKLYVDDLEYTASR